MKFLTGLTLNVDKLPKYTAFKGDFQISINSYNRNILVECIKSNNPVFKTEIKERTENVLSSITNNTLIVTHRQRLEIGRFYADKSISLINLSRHVKHTLFKNMNWIDIDMVKGHPTILYQLFNGFYELTAFKRYIENTDEVFNELLDFYAVDETLTKDKIKSIFNITIYGGSFNTWLREIDEDGIELKTDEMHNFVKDFINECKEISNIIFNKNAPLREKIKGYYKEIDEYKLRGKVMSYFCQAIENEILHIAYKFLIKECIIEARKNVELEYDGLCFLMPNHLSSEQLEQKITELNEKVIKDTGFAVKFKLKGYDDRHIHNEIIEKAIIENELENETDNELETDSINSNNNKYYTDFNDVLCSEEYNKYKTQFEKQYFKLESPLLYGKENENGEVVFYKKNEMAELVIDTTPKYLVGTPKSNIAYPFYHFWKEDPDKRRYEKIVFEPNPENFTDKYYNLFKGFKNDDTNVEEINEDDSYFFKLLRHLTANEPEFYNYFKAYLAHLVQRPWIKSNVAIVFYSNNKGVGKDSIIEAVKLLLGVEFYGKLNDIDDINKKFNNNLVNKFVIYGEEITANAKKVIDKLKEAITRTTCNLEKKGVDTMIVNDYSNYIFSTNGRNNFKIEQGCRRLGMVECNEEILPSEFFKAFYAEIHNPYKIKQLFKYFKTYTQDKYNIGRDHVYHTRYKKELENESKAGYIQFLYKGVTTYSNMSNITANKFYEMSREYCNKNYLSSNYTITEFGKVAGKIFSNSKARKTTGIVYNFLNSLDILQQLYEYDQKYYRYINDLDDDFTPSFKPEPEYDVEEH